MSKTVFLYQIYYDESSKARIAHGFTPLDNSTNTRPDWCEYWSIREVLLNKHFDSNSYIGFFSPKFTDKTAVTAEDILMKIAKTDASVISFSPYFDQNALHINPFIQGNMYHPGLLDSAQTVLLHLNLSFDLNLLVCDRTTAIFSNYFVAKHDFWMKWLHYSEKLFHLCEDTQQDIAAQLRLNTNHATTHGTPMKVFILERLVTLVLEHLNMRAEIGSDVEGISTNFSDPSQVINQLLTLDALKGQYKQTRLPIYMQSYEWHKKNLLSK